jgi:hypothetical protein
VSASQRPYVDRPVGDVAVAEVFAVEVSRQLGLQAPERIRVGMNALFRCGDVIVRVGRPSASGSLAIELAHRLLRLGISGPVPATDEVVEADGLAATCWQRIVPVHDSVDWVAVGRIVRRVHTLALDELPDGYPVPSPSTFPWWDFDAILDDVRHLIDPPALGAIERAIDRDRDWTARVATDAVLCHGDVHPGNVMMTDRGPVLLDWDLLCHAHRGWDHGMLLTLAERWGGDPSVYPAFAEGYGRSLRDDAAAATFGRLRNVAATLMRVRAGRTDPAARDEAERRLRYWRGDPDAPSWTAQ